MVKGGSRLVALTQRYQLVVSGRIVGEGQSASRRQEEDLALTVRQARRPQRRRIWPDEPPTVLAKCPQAGGVGLHDDLCQNASGRGRAR
jgi:hypothetical protein